MLRHNIHFRLILLYLILYDSLTYSMTKNALWTRITGDLDRHFPYSSCLLSDEMRKTSTPLHSCVDSCSCDPETCGNKKLCCPGTAQNVSKETKNSSCMYPVIHGLPMNNMNNPRAFVSSRLRMVTSCLREYTGSQIHKDCLLHRNTRNLSHLVPVFSNITELVYVNRYCALCNNDQSFEEFQVTFACSYELFKTRHWKTMATPRTAENQYKLINDGFCVYAFKPSSEEKVKDSECMASDIVSCNETGLWNFMDQYLMDACNAYELPYRFQFRNVHCFMCNQEAALSMKKGIYQLPNWTCIDDDPTRVLQESFYSIMDLDHHLKIQAISQLTEEFDSRVEECGAQSVSIFDPYMGVCRAINCPVFQLLQGNSCVPVYSGFQFIPKRAMILFQEVNATEKLHNPLADIENILKMLSEEFLSKFLDMTKLCRLVLYRKEVDVGIGDAGLEFILEFGWVSSNNEEMVPRDILKLINSEVRTLNISFTSCSFNVSLVNPKYKSADILETNRRSFVREKPFFYVPVPCIKLLVYTANKQIADLQENLYSSRRV